MFCTTEVNNEKVNLTELQKFALSYEAFTQGQTFQKTPFSSK